MEFFKKTNLIYSLIVLLIETRQEVDSRMTDREIFETYRNDVYYLCYYLLKNAADAEDICQEVFMKAFQADHRRIERMKPWLIRIAANLCKNHLDRKKRGVLKELKHFLLQGLQQSEAADQSLICKEGELELASWLHALPIKIKQVMVLKYVHELSLAEIAESLDIPLGTAKSRLNKGLILIKKQLDKGNQFEVRGVDCLD
ncbi:RNA polymerase sigma factor [Paenibacillus periandrae]|uniref:RNA polymerase sigma factor n=1 Tax=Paenibacillus periandrae TaxID=1761741 RepID=UPI001F09BFC4|nr:RNA polymerase sigma factor [Paenibacillus periandrae]